jgi:hypothetical protein
MEGFRRRGVWWQDALLPAMYAVRRLVFALVVAFSASAAPQAQRGEWTLPLGETLDRVGDRVEQWYARAQSLVSLESVSIQPLRADLTAVDFPRRLAYELRLAWDAAAEGGELPEAKVVRELLTVNGKPPKPKDEPGCLDPKPVSAEPLSMLLAPHRDEYTFAAAGAARVEGRPALMIDYRSVAAGEPAITYTRDCVSIDLPGRSRGRIWIDAATFDVLRLDEYLIGMFDFTTPREQQRRGAAMHMTIERADSSIQYKRVAFTDPEETLMLPAMIETVTSIRGAGTQRYRVTQRFSDYRRFLTGGRVVQ